MELRRAGYCSVYGEAGPAQDRHRMLVQRPSKRRPSTSLIGSLGQV